METLIVALTLNSKLASALHFLLSRLPRFHGSRILGPRFYDLGRAADHGRGIGSIYEVSDRLLLLSLLLYCLLVPRNTEAEDG